MLKNNRMNFKESSLSRIWKQVTEHDSGTITAFRHSRNCGEGKIYSLGENKAKNQKLKAQLLSKGFGVTSIDGVYIENFGTDKAIEVKEESFIVIDLQDSGDLKKTLIKLGTQYEQDSITYSKASGDYYIISTNECPNAYPGNGKIGIEKKLGQPFFGKSGEFHSKVNGRPFVFKEESIQRGIDILREFSIPEIRSIKKLAEEADKINYNECKIEMKKRYTSFFEYDVPKAPAYWINPYGTLLPIYNEEKHIDQILKDPSVFRFTRKEIEDIYAEEGEELGSEGKARERIIIELVNKGWIRIRYYQRQDTYSINVNRLNSNTKESIYYWAKSLIDQGHKFSEVKIDMPGKVIKSSVNKIVDDSLFSESKRKRSGLKIAESVRELMEGFDPDDYDEIKGLLMSFDKMLQNEIESDRGRFQIQRYKSLRQQLRKFI